MGEVVKPERKVTAGGRDLRKYLDDEIHQSVPDFCEQHGLDRIQVQRVMNGERYRNITVQFAHAIEIATRGRVKWLRFLPDTAKAAPPKAAKSSSRKAA